MLMLNGVVLYCRVAVSSCSLALQITIQLGVMTSLIRSQSFKTLLLVALLVCVDTLGLRALSLWTLASHCVVLQTFTAVNVLCSALNGISLRKTVHVSYNR